MFRLLKRPLLEHSREIKSPDGRISCKLELKFGKLIYSVKKDGKVVLRDSRLGFEIKGEAPIFDGLMIVRMHESSFDETWERQWGEERYVRNNYNEVALYMSETSGDKRLFTVRFRIFDDGVAFRYEFPPQPSFTSLIITDELTEFNVDANAKAWKIPAYQPDRYEYNYERWPVDALIQSVHTPLTIETPLGDYISIHEAALYDYGSVTLKLNKGELCRQILRRCLTARRHMWICHLIHLGE
ncbi:glycoside hydrolase family 97 N-terminal domain-containing protein [Candidatus Saccharibacteria bacterium]|nr:glycoside hydrolase family 97 N-terminal domain-containing protein [Candidatus Saccharibacteria bacterium]